MPLRLNSSNLCSPGALPSPASPCGRSPLRSFPARPVRQFSQTCPRQITIRRRKFYEWLNGPGKQLKEPLPGSTNYLGAYDKFGNLIRARPGWQRGGQKATESENKGEVGGKEEKRGEDATPQGQESLDKLEAAIRAGEAEEKEAKQEAEEDDSKLPPETAEDLRPFPLNQYFRSQPVLSEDLREAIYQRVKKDGATVSLASVEFGVSNERVGAVVRLKQMEKEWIAQVRFPTFFAPR